MTALAHAVEARRGAGQAVIDLTAANPTECGLHYDPGLLAQLGDERSLHYEPEAMGLEEARAAVCRYYAEHGARVAPQQVCLTTSTSEAYSFLFRLLCDPGDEVLIAQPSYPLFAYLADLDDVRLVGYPLFYDHGWHMEPGALEARITARTRAIAIVHPNNPTGHFAAESERAELERLCVDHGLALVVDEVFLDYSLGEGRGARTFAQGPHGALTFVLSGLSKVAALPQMKASWIVTAGPDEPREEALARLEMIADTFLSMSAPVQHALPGWLDGRHGMLGQIRERTRSSLAAVDRLLGTSELVSRLKVEAGWYAVLRVPALGPGSDDALCLDLVERWGVLTHPGHYYGFAGEGRLVVSLLAPASALEQGMAAVLACCAERARG